MDRVNTINYIIKTHCSVARYGNGEMDIMLGDSKHFQHYDSKLACKLSTIKSNKKLLVCVPFVLESKKALNDQNNTFYKSYRHLYLHYWRKLFNKNEVLGDSCFTRFYMDMKDKNKKIVSDYIEHLSKIWDMRDVVIIEGQFTRFGVGNNLLANSNSIHRVICPNENAYSLINRIEKYIVDNVPSDSLLLISLGPTATVLAWRLSTQNYQAIDVGHLDIEYEWYLRNAYDKVAIPDKYTNEVNDGRITNDSFKSDEYSQQIIKKLLK